jgi:hypothetical protein
MEEIFSGKVLGGMRTTIKERSPKGVPGNVKDVYWRLQKVALISCKKFMSLTHLIKPVL